MNLNNKLKLYLLTFFFFSNLLIWYGVISENRKDLIVAFLDVGQGDAIFIQSPDGKQILIDGGKNNQVLRQLSKIMPFYDHSLDMLILTHPDGDHIGGLPAILKNYKVDFVMESGVVSDSGVYKEFEKIIKEKQIQKIIAQQGVKIPLCNYVAVQQPHNCGSYLEVLFPVKDVNINEMEANTGSIILKLTHGEKSFLFTGDAPQSIEKYLVESLGGKINVDVLKLGHHGSKTSTSNLLLGFSSPEYAIASVGLNNSYKHPHKEVIELLEKFEIPLLRTDETGSIIFKSDGKNLELVD